MDIMTIAGLGIVSLVLVVMLKQYRPDYAVVASVAAGLIILAVVLQHTTGLVEELKNMFANIDMPTEYISALLKAMGICFITQLACDTCKDAGESGLASKVEMAGKVGVLLVALPLFKNLLAIAAKLIST